MYMMSKEWIDDLSSEELQKMATELGVSDTATVHELRQQLKEPWRTMEQYLPPRSTGKSAVGLDIATDSKGKEPCSDVQGQMEHLQAKVRGKAVADLLRGIPVLSNTEPQSVFEFLIRVRQVYDLGLVSDGEFMTHLTKTTGRVTRIVSAHLRLGSSWHSLLSEILSSISPPPHKRGVCVQICPRPFPRGNGGVGRFHDSRDCCGRYLAI
jgi:hypothetical protein